MTRRAFAVSLLGNGASTLVGCNLGERTIRYRLSVVVDTPEGTKIGSSMIQETVRRNDGVLRGLGAGPGIARNRRGGAVVDDLGHRGLLLCSLTADGSRPDSAGEDLLRAAFPFKRWSAAGWLNSGDDSYLRFLDNLSAHQPSEDVPLARLPMLVRFRDPRDPNTAEWVAPQDLTSAFGAGTRIKRATLEITNAPVTTRIDRIFPWLSLLPKDIALIVKGPLWNSTDSEYEYPKRLVVSSFKEGY